MLLSIFFSFFNLLFFFFCCANVNCCWFCWGISTFRFFFFVYLIIKYGHLVSHIILMIFSTLQVVVDIIIVGVVVFVVVCVLTCVFVLSSRLVFFWFIDLLSNFWCLQKVISHTTLMWGDDEDAHSPCDIFGVFWKIDRYFFYLMTNKELNK